MEVSFLIKRFNPENPQKGTYWDDYTLMIEPSMTVLDALIKIREDKDGTLSLRCSCRSSICGSCSMRINGMAGLACKMKVIDNLQGDRASITVEPMTNMPVIKDLVVDMDIFLNKVKEIKPWLQPDEVEPSGEYIASDESMKKLAQPANCIMCGACVSDCTVLEVDEGFIGPAALAKAYRFVDDPRDAETSNRLEMLSEYSGIWDCTRCMECVEVCPKDVAPMDRIMELRDRAMNHGFMDNSGAKHTDAFADIVSHSGTLDELKLPLKTFGMFGMPLNMLPVAIRAAIKGKIPALFHKGIPNMEGLKQIFNKVADEEQQASEQEE